LFYSTAIFIIVQLYHVSKELSPIQKLSLFLNLTTDDNLIKAGFTLQQGRNHGRG